MQMWDLTWELFSVAAERQIVLRARHIPGRLNRLADLLSRSDQLVNTEWTLAPRVAKSLWSIWGRPTVDLMATHLNNQLPTFVSPFPHELAYAVDAMSFPWQGLDAYLFPPWSMISEVLTKLHLHNNCLLTAVLPRSPNRFWFPQLLDSLCDVPRRLPLLVDLLSLPISGRLHGSLASLDLHACRLSSNPHLRADFLRRCARGLPVATKVRQQIEYMTEDGNSSLFGVVNGVSIPSLPL